MRIGPFIALLFFAAGAHAEPGLKNGDPVRAVNGRPISTPAEALEAYGRLKSAEAIALEITRQGMPMTLTHTLDDALALPEAGP